MSKFELEWKLLKKAEYFSQISQEMVVFNDRIYAINIKVETRPIIYCGVKNCTSNSTLTHIGLYPIPSEDKREMRYKWLRNIGLTASEMEIMEIKNVFVCEAHFKRRFKNYTAYVSSHKSLKIGAIPTVKVPYKKPLEEIDLNLETQEFSKEEDTEKIMLDESATPKVDENELKLFCEKYFSSQLNTLINIHKKLSKKPDNCIMEFTDDFKKEIITIYMENTLAYNIFQSIIHLPPIADIKQFIQSKPEVINEHFISLLTNKVESMSPDQVNCALCIYLLRIEPSYEYDLESDIILGCCQNSNDTSKILTPAQYGLVAMARGVCDDWDQIVSFTLLPHVNDQIDFNEFLRSWIENIVKKLLGIGLNLNVLIPTTDNLLINAFLHMRISEDEPYLQVSGKKIFYLFDPFNLLMLVATNIRKKQLQMKNMPTNMIPMWNHIRRLWKIDGSRACRLAPRLTNHTFDAKPNQLNQKMFQNSAQILSLNTAASMSIYVDMKLMDQTCKTTVKFIQKINCVFDTNHSNSRAPFKLRNEIHTNTFSSHLFEKYDDAICVDLITYFKQLKPPNSTYNGDNFIDCIITTLRNIRLLRKNLQRENKMYTTRFLNQDPLVAIIDEARLQFNLKRNFKAKELIQVMKDNLMRSALLHVQDNRKDGSVVVNNLSMFVEKANKLFEINSIYQKKFDIKDFLFTNVDYSIYIATYIIDKICQGDDTKLTQSKVHIFKGASSLNQNNKSVFIPDDEFLNFLEKLRRTFDRNIESTIGSNKVVQGLMDSFEYIRSNASRENEMSADDIILIKRIYFTIMTTNYINGKIKKLAKTRTRI